MINDYDLAYLSKEFSESFKAWNYDFPFGLRPMVQAELYRTAIIINITKICFI